jgi:hypothetical protein
MEPCCPPPAGALVDPEGEVGLPKTKAGTQVPPSQRVPLLPLNGKLFPTWYEGWNPGAPLPESVLVAPEWERCFLPETKAWNPGASLSEGVLVAPEWNVVSYLRWRLEPWYSPPRGCSFCPWGGTLFPTWDEGWNPGHVYPLPVSVLIVPEGQ